MQKNKFQKGGKCLTWAPHYFVNPLKVKILTFSEIFDVGTLNAALDKVVRSDELRRNGCYNEACCNSCLNSWLQPASL